jgi:hypothetical protein
MKSKVFLLKTCLAGIITLAITSASAQTPVLKKPDPKVLKAFHTGKITGTIRFPKSIGVISDFISTVKAKTVLNSYKLINGQLSEKNSISITSMTLADATRPDGADYMYTYEITAVFPFYRPIDIVIDYGEYKFTWILSLDKSDANEYAMMTDGDKTYAGFDFKGKSVAHPH